MRRKKAPATDDRQNRFSVSLSEQATRKLDEFISEYTVSSRIVRGALWLWMMASDDAQRLAVTMGDGAKMLFADHSDVTDLTVAMVAFEASARQAREELAKANRASSRPERGAS